MTTEIYGRRVKFGSQAAKLGDDRRQGFVSRLYGDLDLPGSSMGNTTGGAIQWKYANSLIDPSY
jgi:hypothetical protein